jgi:CxxC-x17-CxxC domain-containing protein
MEFKKFNDRPRRDFAPRQMVKGNWKCAGCEKEITELPFEPSPDRPIYCRDCWMKKRDQKFNR